jgi:hypothetical protein
MSGMIGGLGRPDNTSRTRAWPVVLIYVLINVAISILLGLVYWPLFLLWPAFALIILAFRYVGALINGDRMRSGRHR